MRKQIASILLRGVFFAILLGAPNIFASVITGKVIDAQTKQPIPGCNVFIEEERRIGSATDLDGNFRIQDLPPGNWTVSASAIGYGKVSQNVDISDDDAGYTLNFSLYPKALQGDEVVVTATRQSRVIRDLPVRAEIVKRDEIRLKGAFDLYQALEGQPGIRVEQQCSDCNFSMLRLQGLEGGYSLVLLDGQPIFSGLAEVYGLQQIMSANIEQIEIIKGAGSALYGAGALSGIVNIKSREPGPIPAFGMGLLAGSNSTYSMNFDGTMRRGDIAVSYALQIDTKAEVDQTGNPDPNYLDEMNFEDGGPDGFTDRVASDNYGAMVKAFLYEPFGEGSKIILTGNALGEFRKGGEIETIEDPFAPGVEHIRTNRYSVRASYIHELTSAGKLESSLTYVNHYRNATNDAAWDRAVMAGVLDEDLKLTDAGRDTLDRIGMMEFRERFFPNPFIAKEKMFLADVMFSRPVFGADIIVGSQYRRGEIEQDINRSEDNDFKSADDIGFFAQVGVYPLGGQMELLLGARIDHHYSVDDLTETDYSITALNPRIAGRYSLSDKITLRASYGSGFRVPYLFAEDLHLCASSPRIYKGADLQPERARSFSFGVDYIKRWNEIGIGVFYTRIDDKVEFIDLSEEETDIPAGFDFAWANVDRATSLEGDFYLRGRPLYWLGYNFNAVYTHAKFAERREPEIADSDRIPRSPAFTANGELVFSANNLDIRTSANFTGSMFIDHVPDEDMENYRLVKTDPFVTFDLGANYRLTNSLQLILNARNVLGYTQPLRDVSDAAFIYAPLIGREIFGGIRIDL